MGFIVGHLIFRFEINNNLHALRYVLFVNKTLHKINNLMSKCNHLEHRHQLCNYFIYSCWLNRQGKEKDPFFLSLPAANILKSKFLITTLSSYQLCFYLKTRVPFISIKGLVMHLQYCFDTT